MKPFYKVLLYPFAAFLFFFMLTVIHKPKCVISSKALALSSYVYENWEPIKRVKPLHFSFEETVLGENMTENKTDVASLIEKLHFSVIKGEKEYLSVGSFFIEKGKELNGIKFLGVEDDQAVIEIQGKIYRVHI